MVGSLVSRFFNPEKPCFDFFTKIVNKMQRTISRLCAAAAIAAGVLLSKWILIAYAAICLLNRMLLLIARKYLQRSENAWKEAGGGIKGLLAAMDADSRQPRWLSPMLKIIQFIDWISI